MLSTGGVWPPLLMDFKGLLVVVEIVVVVVVVAVIVVVLVSGRTESKRVEQGQTDRAGRKGQALQYLFGFCPIERLLSIIGWGGGSIMLIDVRPEAG